MHLILMSAISAPEPARGILICPVCDSRQVTLSHLDCRALGSIHGEVHVGRDGLHIDPAIPNPEGGATVGLRCTCNQGHESLIRFRQMRGSTIVERSVLAWTSHPTGIEAEG